MAQLLLVEKSPLHTDEPTRQQLKTAIPTILEQWASWPHANHPAARWVELANICQGVAPADTIVYFVSGWSASVVNNHLQQMMLPPGLSPADLATARTALQQLQNLYGNGYHQAISTVGSGVLGCSQSQFTPHASEVWTNACLFQLVRQPNPSSVHLTPLLIDYFAKALAGTAYHEAMHNKVEAVHWVQNPSWNLHTSMPGSLSQRIPFAFGGANGTTMLIGPNQQDRDAMHLHFAHQYAQYRHGCH